uniref:hypothetical protein n=1 Tax=Neisseria sicca TaxID=490 RepID=UPI003F68A38D
LTKTVIRVDREKGERIKKMCAEELGGRVKEEVKGGLGEMELVGEIVKGGGEKVIGEWEAMEVFEEEG